MEVDNDMEAGGGFNNGEYGAGGGNGYGNNGDFLCEESTIHEDPKNCDVPVKSHVGGRAEGYEEKSVGNVQVCGFSINRTLFCAMFILVVEACERMTYYGYLSSIKTFFKRTECPDDSSCVQSITNFINAFTMVCYLMPLIGGYIANSRLGTYWTIVGFVIWYVIGCVLVDIAVHPSVNSGTLAEVGMMAFIALGTGGIKPNICVFGADQYDATTPDGKKALDRFWGLFYLCINCAAVISYGVFGTMATGQMGVSVKYGFFVVYTICGAAMMFALVVFLSGSAFYIRKGCSGDVLVGILHYIWQDAQNSIRGKLSMAGWALMLIFIIFSIVLSFLSDNLAIAVITLVLGVIACSTVSIAHVNNTRYNNCRPSKHLARIEVAAFMDTIPIQLLCNLTFNFAYNMMNGPFNDQACVFNLYLYGATQINGSILSLADTFAIIIFLPIVDYLLYPSIEKYFGYKVVRRDQIIVGFTSGALALAVASILEAAWRSATVMPNKYPWEQSNCLPGSPMHDISVWYMIIPFFLIGIGEISINPVIMGFIYEQIPFRTRNFSQAFNCVTLGSLPSAFYVPIALIMPDYTDHKTYIYLCGIGVLCVSLPIYFFVQGLFVEKDFSEDLIYTDDDEEDDFVEHDEPSGSAVMINDDKGI